MRFIIDNLEAWLEDDDGTRYPIKTIQPEIEPFFMLADPNEVKGSHHALDVDWFRIGTLWPNPWFRARRLLRDFWRCFW